MIARELLGTAQVPDGEELQLFRHDKDFMITLKRSDLMSTRMSGSEKALATMTVERLGGRKSPHLLIGGYGMGFTLRAALEVLDAGARATVAEIVPEIIEWARGPMAELTAGCLDDPRVTLLQADVALIIDGGDEDYDAILLDVDNGPEGITREANDRIYSKRGLKVARQALTPGGILAVWSSHADPKFARRLADSGFEVTERAVRARDNGKGAKHVIWFAKKV
ncbi:spermidine synthase [Novosphingobium sp. JCM 18896]|uniref:spermidine synthase n=1 Tax=Novosphingobium sp. JCM 18896 TaxID=2989731 RepID=UPI002222C014|nr:spermidine synthase [Novosphingobium sp. JCM 18896]MCW1429604.1 spermidine synthase [Novosphingobium sp. JCM 18896]